MFNKMDVAITLFNDMKKIYKTKMDFVDKINNIIMTSEGSTLSIYLNELLDQYSVAHGICPCCGRPTHEEVYEDIVLKVCSVCNK